MGEKEKKRFVSVDKMDSKKKNLIYLTSVVVLFGLFFITFLALNTAEERCFERFDEAMQVIDNDPCMSQCLNPVIYDSLNYTNLQINMEGYNET